VFGKGDMGERCKKTILHSISISIFKKTIAQLKIVGQV